MIKPGTLCLLIEPHAFAGQTCTCGRRLWPSDGWLDADGKGWFVGDREMYEITGLRESAGPGYDGWCAMRNELVPLAPPADEIVDASFHYGDKVKERIESL